MAEPYAPGASDMARAKPWIAPIVVGAAQGKYAMRVVDCNKAATVQCVLSLAIACTLVTGTVYGDEKRAAFAMSFEAFENLQPDDQRTAIAEALRRRLEQGSKNLYFEAEQSGNIYHVKDGKTAGVKSPLARIHYRRWVLDGSYKVEVWHSLRIPGDPQAEQRVLSSWNAVEGRRRSLLSQSQSQRTFGRIDSAKEPIESQLDYLFWLDGVATHSDLNNYFIRDAFDAVDVATIDLVPDEKLVCFGMPWRPPAHREPSGKRELYLDPERGFLPVKGTATYDIGIPSAPNWKTTRFEVQEACLVNDVWMPKSYRTWLQSSALSASLKEGQVGVKDVTVSKIEAGVVTPEDILVKFPAGTTVTDMIAGEAYDVRGNEERAGDYPLLIAAVDQPAAAPAVDSSGGRWKWMIVGINVAVIGVLAAIVLRKWLPRRA